MTVPSCKEQVFNIFLTDMPKRTSDFVQGSYEFPVPPGKTTVAINIIGMLGEEVVETVDIRSSAFVRKPCRNPATYSERAELYI